MTSDATIENRFRNTLSELVDENMLACNAILSLASVQFTKAVPTLCVSCAARPVLFVNPDFLREHTRNETEVKAVILHEFLHVLLGHTMDLKPTPVLNIAYDAVINHLIQREFGEAYGEVFRRYYKRAKGVTSLLGPWKEARLNRYYKEPTELLQLRRKLQWGKTVAEDHFIGSHDRPPIPWESLSCELSTAISHTQRNLAGRDIIGRSDIGTYTRLHEDAEVQESLINRWERETIDLLNRCIIPDRRAAPEWKPTAAYLPVLHAGARRATLQTLWNPLLVEAPWELHHREASGTCQVYLDVSGSMHSVMPALIGLLRRFGPRIRQPFWAFSTKVVPARIVNGKLDCDTTGGTRINSVLEHVRNTRPKRALIITDGYVEKPCHSLLTALRASGQELCALISHNGEIKTLKGSGIPCLRLTAKPKESR